MLIQNQNCSFIPAVLRENVDWYIEYSYRNSSGNLCRVRSKLNRILKRFRTKSERRQYAQIEVAKINSKLAQGWTPIHDKIAATNSFAATPWADVCSAYEEYLERSERSEELSHSTRLCYHSNVKILCEFVSTSPDVELKYIYQLNEDVIKAWINWATIVRKVGRTTLVNYRRWLHSFCEWLFMCGYHFRLLIIVDED